jgi:hypothetical protein
MRDRFTVMGGEKETVKRQIKTKNTRPGLGFVHAQGCWGLLEDWNKLEKLEGW